MRDETVHQGGDVGGVRRPTLARDSDGGGPAVFVSEGVGKSVGVEARCGRRVSQIKATLNATIVSF